MKILTAHNRYIEPGGEDVVFEQEAALLQRHGHDVLRHERDNAELQQMKLLPRVLSSAESVWSSATYSDFSRLLARFMPHVVHVHNTFLRISPSIFQACADMGIPVVNTLHNYRLLCPSTTLYRNGAPCEKCVDGNMWHGIVRGCYRSSRTATALSASMVGYNWHRRTWTDVVSHYIAPTNFLRSKMASAGLPAARISVKPHFVDPDPGIAEVRENYAIFIGRLSPEKGLTTLLSAWEQLSDIPLLIVGDGPQRTQLEALVHQKNLNARLAGHLSRAEALAKLKKARLLVFPSIGYESFGMGIIEAFACGVPVIASNHGAMQELVQHSRTGLLFEPANPDALADSVRTCWSDDELRAAMSIRARREYEHKYTAAANYEMLMIVYERALSSRKAARDVCVPAAA